MRHELKTWPEYYGPISTGEKPFEIRVNDRDFEVGDILVLREFKPCRLCLGSLKVRDYTDRVDCDCTLTRNPGGRYTRRKCVRRVTYLTSFAQQSNFVVMGLATLN